MRSYTARSLGDVLDAFSSNEPVPGGGSAAALAGATGVALLIMVAGLPKTRTGTAKEIAELEKTAGRLRPLRVVLASLIDRDSDAYRKVVAAFRLPKDSSDEQAVRRREIGEAMRGATVTPLETMLACQQALAEACVVASNGSKSASSDVGVAIELLAAAVRGAGLNVDANVGAVSDSALAARMREERQELETRSASDAARARALL